MTNKLQVIYVKMPQALYSDEIEQILSDIAIKLECRVQVNNEIDMPIMTIDGVL